MQILQLLNVIWCMAGRHLPFGMEYPEKEMEECKYTLLMAAYAAEREEKWIANILNGEGLMSHETPDADVLA